MLQPMSAVMVERASLAERLDVAELAFCFGCVIRILGLPGVRTDRNSHALAASSESSRG